MGRKKKKLLSKEDKRKKNAEKGKSGAQARGIGSTSRMSFVLPKGWSSEVKEYSSSNKVKVLSPGKSSYYSLKDVKKSIRKRMRSHCLSESEARTSDLETSPKKAATPPSTSCRVEQQLFVCESSQLLTFVENVNKTSKCSTDHCKGVLVPSEIQTIGLGGSLNIKFVCNGCSVRNIMFEGSALVEGSRRTVVGLSLAVAFIVSGHGFAKFNRTLNQFLGIPAISKNRYFEVVSLIYPHVTDILNEMCEEAKSAMKKKEDKTLGSWKRAVVTSDGVWHTRGHFSKNGSFIIKNYITGGLLWYGHKCMRGKDEDQLFKGTAKSMEGILAEECFQQCKDEGCDIAVVWQDADSSSRSSVESVYGAQPQRVFKCGGHVGRAHGNNLKEAAKLKRFPAGQISKWKKKFPGMEDLVCKCKRHSKGCGCLSEQFILNARINHFCCLQQCKTPSEYARRMRALSEYHCVDIHSWKGGNCGFHPQTVCSCGKCKDEKHKCKGKPYSTSNIIKCSFHQMAYRIECELRASDAHSVIHPEMGRGQSNLCEAHFTVLPHFRAKSQSLCRLHYMTSTNCGLLQGNMTWCYENRGADFHWVAELYRRLQLPVTTAVLTALKKAGKERMDGLRRKQSEEGKKKRISQKSGRKEDQEERKRWSKRQALIHTYGNDDSDSDDNGIEGVGSEVLLAARRVAGNGSSIVSGRSCRCGAQDHQRTSHHSCPLNTRNKQVSGVGDENVSDDGDENGEVSDDGDENVSDDGDENEEVSDDGDENASDDGDENEEVSDDGHENVSDDGDYNEEVSGDNDGDENVSDDGDENEDVSDDGDDNVSDDGDENEEVSDDGDENVPDDSDYNEEVSFDGDESEDSSGNDFDDT